MAPISTKTWGAVTLEENARWPEPLVIKRKTGAYKRDTFILSSQRKVHTRMFLGWWSETPNGWARTTITRPDQSNGEGFAKTVCRSALSFVQGGQPPF